MRSTLNLLQMTAHTRSTEAEAEADGWCHFSRASNSFPLQWHRSFAGEGFSKRLLCALRRCQTLFPGADRLGGRVGWRCYSSGPSPRERHHHESTKLGGVFLTIVTRATMAAVLVFPVPSRSLSLAAGRRGSLGWDVTSASVTWICRMNGLSCSCVRWMRFMMGQKTLSATLGGLTRGYILETSAASDVLQKHTHSHPSYSPNSRGSSLLAGSRSNKAPTAIEWLQHLGLLG